MLNIPTVVRFIIVFRRQRKHHRPAVSLGPIHGGKDLHGFSTVLPGDQRVTVLQNSQTKVIDDKLLVTLDNPELQNPQIVRALVNAGAEVQFVGELRHSLEDVYLKLVKNS